MHHQDFSANRSTAGRSLRYARWALLAILFCPRPLVHASDRAATFSSTNDFVQQWNPDQHLYVKGDVGIGPARLDELERWLDEHGTHWTIVLIDRSEGETYSTPDGRYYFGLEAVELAIERGLADQTGYGRLEHPQTGQRDATTLLISIGDRALDYFSSTAQDVRRLGQANWRGELDRPAFRAMRGGVGVADAVRDTVTTVNDALQGQITSEQDAAERLEREHQRAVEEAHEQIKETRQAIDRVLVGQQELLADAPTATGTLTDPPVSQWRTTLERIEADLAVDNARKSVQEISQVRHEIERYLTGFHEFDAFDQRSAPLAKRIESAPRGPHNVAADTLTKAEQAWKTAKQLHDNGELDWEAPLRSIEELLTQASVVVEQEQARLAVAAVRAQRVRVVTAGAAIVLALLVAVILFALNRRRLPLQRECLVKFASREKQVEQGTDGMYELLERTRVVVGKQDDLEARGAAGETLRLSKQTIADVDNLFVMSRSVDRIMKQAKQLISPGTLLSRLANLFSGKRYRQAMELLGDQPIRFSPEDGIQLLKEEDNKSTGNEPELFGRLEDCEAFQLSFEDLLGEFNQRASRATSNLDRIEKSWSELAQSLEQIESATASIDQRQSEFLTATASDGYFDINQLFVDLVPSMLSARDQAETLGATDPVAAMEQHVATAVRQASESRELLDAIVAFRKQDMMELAKYRDQLKQASHQVEWMHDALLFASRQAQEAIAVGMTGSMHPKIDELQQEFHGLTQRAVETVALVQRYRTDTEPMLASTSQQLEATRQEIGQALHLPSHDVLREVQQDPDMILRDAHRQLAAAKAAVDRGAVKAGESALDEAVRLDSAADQIIEATSNAFSAHEAEVKRLWQRADQIFAKHAHHDELLQRLVSEFAPESLTIGNVDPTSPDPNLSIVNHISEAEHWMGEARAEIDRANDDFRAARILRAAERRVNAEAWLGNVDTRYGQIQAQATALREQVSANQRVVTTLSTQADRLHDDCSDDRTRSVTQTMFQEAYRGMEHAVRIVNAPVGQRSPFAAARELAGAQTVLLSVQQAIQTDRDLHAEAVRSLDAAASQLATARQLVGLAASDQIPDSTATTRSINDVRTLEREYQNGRRELETPHGDWAVVDERADALVQRLGQAIANLRGELEQGQAALRAMESASQEVRRAAGWPGALGITIFGAPGSNELEQARRSLNSGNYSQAQSLARHAESAAAQAVRQAEMQVLQRRREQERQEAERRRRQQTQAHAASLNPTGPTAAFAGQDTAGQDTAGHSISASAEPSPSAKNTPGRSTFSGGSSFSRSGW